MRRSVISPSAGRMELRALLWLFTEKLHQTLSQVTVLGSVRGCLNTSAGRVYWLQERNPRCPMFGDLMLFRAGPLQLAGPGELLRLWLLCLLLEA